MSYYFNKTIAADFETVKKKVIAELGKEGFGILTEVDVQATFKNKVDVDFRKYQILGACNPHYAHKAIEAEDKIGTMLPCNVILQELENGKVEVAAINASASMQAVDNNKVADVAKIISAMLKKVVDAL